MTVVKVDTGNFIADVLESELPVVVDFYADWCGPCRQVAPALEALSRENEGVVRFVKLNVDEDPDIAQTYRITTIPAVLMFESGRPRAWSVGVKPAYVLEKELGLRASANDGKRSKWFTRRKS